MGIILIFITFITFLLMAVVIIIASSKKLNVLPWILLSVGGIILFSFALPVLTYMLLSVPLFKISIIFLLPILYQLILILFVSLQKGNDDKFLTCCECRSPLKHDMQYCPRCGASI